MTTFARQQSDWTPSCRNLVLRLSTLEDWPMMRPGTDELRGCFFFFLSFDNATSGALTCLTFPLNSVFAGVQP